jgi:hypothetical protein
MSKLHILRSKTVVEDRPIWLTTLAEADRDAAPPDSFEPALHSALRRRRSMDWAKRSGAVGLAAALAIGLWLMPRQSMLRPAADDAVDESLMDVIADAGTLPSGDEVAYAEFVPTKIASEQPLESVRVVRVSVPGASLARYGVSSEVSAASEVTADLLVGQDGIARAIRVVK